MSTELEDLEIQIMELTDKLMYLKGRRMEILAREDRLPLPSCGLKPVSFSRIEYHDE